jgi:hypothetical protein
MGARYGWTIPPLAVFAFSRIAVLSVVAISLAIDPRLHRGEGVTPFPAINGLCRWDCDWYVWIARDGYWAPEFANFFPLLPLLIRSAHVVTGLPYAWSAVLVANLAALAGFLVVYRVFQRLEGDHVALVALSLFAAWPFSFFHATGYTEPLMLLSTAGAIYLAMEHKYWWAGAALGLGLLTRHTAVLGGGALLTAQVLDRGIHPKRFVLHRDFIGLVLPFVIGSLFPAFLYARFGDPLTWLHIRHRWGPIVWQGVYHFFRGTYEPHFATYVVLSIVPGVGAFLLLSRRRWWILAGFAVPFMVAMWSIGLGGLGRYTASCWPAFLPLGAWLQRHPYLVAPVIALFAALQGVYLYLFSHVYPIN